MNIIKPKVEIIYEPNMLKRIELAGRTAYKSEDKITDGSAEKFFRALVKRGHESVLEHSNIIVYAHNDETRNHLRSILHEYENESDLPHYIRNSIEEVDIDADGDVLQFDSIFSGNLRAWRSLVKRYCGESVLIRLFFGLIEFEDIFSTADPRITEYTYKDTRYEDTAQAEVLPFPIPHKLHSIITARFTCSRAIANEIVRSRLMSFTQESTRYVKYGELNVIEPWWYEKFSMNNYDVMRANFLKSGLDAEQNYKRYIDYGASPQMARDCLGQNTAAEIVITGTVLAWERFLKLRDDGAAHPDIRLLAQMFRKEARFDEWNM